MRVVRRMPFRFNDGGRKDAGYKGKAGDCVARAIAIAAGLPYKEVYEALAEGTANQRASKRTPKRQRSARNGINTKRKWFKDYMESLGFTWVPTNFVGSSDKIHLVHGELPEKGRLVVAVSRHYTTVIDGVIHDAYDPQRNVNWTKPYTGESLSSGEWLHPDGDVVCWVTSRMVYGYWRLDKKL